MSHFNRITASWIKRPRWLRYGLIVSCLMTAATAVLGHVQVPSTPALAQSAPATVATHSTPRPALLPPLTATQLNHDMRGLLAPSLRISSNQTFTIDAQGSLPLLVAFFERLALSSHQVERYVLTAAEESLLMLEDRPAQFNLTLSPGHFQAADHSGFELLQHWLQQPLAGSRNSTTCSLKPAPELVIDAVWPTQGYAVVLEMNQPRRLQINDFLRSGWQLQAFERQDLIFYWPGDNNHCPQSHRLKVVN